MEPPADGSPKRVPMGGKAQGIIMYTPDGYVSAQLMTPGRRDFASGDWFKGMPEETAEEASGYIAYSGPFHVDEDRQSLMAVTATLKRRALEGGSYRIHISLERPTFERCGHSHEDRKSTRLNSSHQITSYAVFCLKKK